MRATRRLEFGHGDLVRGADGDRSEQEWPSPGAGLQCIARRPELRWREFVENLGRHTFSQ